MAGCLIPPYELKNKTFHTVFKGYSKVEVDEYLAFVIEKYTELYRAQDSLTRKLARVEAELEELKEKEDAIRQVLVNSQSAAKKLTAETERRSKLIIESTTETCERILSEFREQIRVEIDTLRVLRTQVL
ncbi:MAG: DivIVA domain-containing protein, partial [Clostridia bacterium]|nr:DivIVA domain-containing protein [Clostridia bacterium]